MNRIPRMSDSTPPPPKKTFEERVKDLVEEVLETLGNLLPAPEPELIPIPARGRGRRRR